MVKFAYLIPIFPVVSFVVNVFFGRRLKTKSAHFSILCLALSFVLSLFVVKEVAAGRTLEEVWPWFSVGGYVFKVGYILDPLSAMMLVVVTSVALFVQIYSVGYMHGDAYFGRYFSYLSLFTASMLVLVLSPNLIQMYVAWELVGLCSYLLISFWFSRTSAAEAGKKAFITTKIGDAGFFMGLATLFYYLGTVSFAEMHHKILAGGLSEGVLVVAALLLFCGAVGKSAQFPLHVWLPDAMEGPTPVSALIHAATMVVAGIYLVARAYPIFVAAPLSLEVVTAIGIITSFMAATIALVQTDLKRILAYSTISQLGLMIVALGVGGYTAGLFHLMTHAFFKALLFLCAGCVIHGTGVQDITQLGGLFKKMKVTAVVSIVGALAIAGVPPLSGFWSKDEILTAIYHSGHRSVFFAALGVAFMTAFYTFRLIFLAFFGKPTDASIHPHEVQATMRWPIMILAVPSVLVGFLGSPLAGHYFSHFILPDAHAGAHEAAAAGGTAFVIYASIGVAVAGVFLAWLFYIVRPANLGRVAAAWRPLYLILVNKYWMDELYQKIVVRPFFWLTERASVFDLRVIDGSVNLTAAATVLVSRIKQWTDTRIVDGAVNGIGFAVRGFGECLRRLQTGVVQHYLLFVFICVGLIMFLKLAFHAF